MRFDLTDLRLFLAVADTGSITHGAAEVGLSLPAASERLRDMEAAGQVMLLERGRRGGEKRRERERRRKREGKEKKRGGGGVARGGLPPRHWNITIAIRMSI